VCEDLPGGKLNAGRIDSQGNGSLNSLDRRFDVGLEIPAAWRPSNRRFGKDFRTLAVFEPAASPVQPLVSGLQSGKIVVPSPRLENRNTVVTKPTRKGKGLVIVESPAKAKKINSYLGSKYVVRASMGHVRDLPSGAAEVPAEVKKEAWSRMAVNVEKDFEPLYIIPAEKRKVVSELKALLKDADELILATDEDREGESIGWHLTQILKPKVPVKRMVFGEITKEAILEAIENPRQLDENLVSAQETRRILDRLYGYRLSPLLWKKVKPKLSAGRVQSVAVRLLVQRELERRAFRKGTFWDLKVTLATQSGATFDAQLSTVAGKRVAIGKDFDEHTGKLKADADVLLLKEAAARELCDRLRQPQTPWTVTALDEREQIRRPYAPFTTSTLQQEANRKLGMSARETMQVAQRLYEDGHITYMRTDSVSLSGEAIKAARSCVQTRYGDEYLSPEPRNFTTKTKGAQEAHEAIRPAGTEMRTADELHLGGREAALYALIWKRTVATQMAEARLRFQTVTVSAAEAEFRATGRHVEFPGFFRAYVEGVDDPEAALDDQESALPPLAERDSLACRGLDPLSHETQPPARFTEATLVRELEADGIGRPSTYASVISTIQDRGYVVKVNNQLRPTFTAMAVTQLLEKYFPQLVNLQFTAGMEQQLDDIATGEARSVPYLRQFYSGRDGLDEQVKLHEEEIDPRAVCTLELDGLSSRVRVGRYGPYLEKIVNGETVTAGLPDDIAPADLTDEMADQLIEQKKQGPQSLGMHDGQPVYILVGRFGPYVQLGDMTDDGEKPKRASLPKNVSPQQVTLDLAVKLLSLPRDLGPHPETGRSVTVTIGRFGPYVKHDKSSRSLRKDQDVFTITLADAVELLKQARMKSTATPLRTLGEHPDDKQPVDVYEGRYGPYVKHGKVNATLPKGTTPETVTFEQALILLAERAAKGPPTRGRRRGRGAAAPKSAAKKTSPKNDDASAKKPSKGSRKKKPE